MLLVPRKSRNLNAFMEHWFRSLKSECRDRMIFFGHRSLERSLRAYAKHYHAGRNHQGLSNQLIDPAEGVGSVAGKIECRERLAGCSSSTIDALPEAILGRIECGHGARSGKALTDLRAWSPIIATTLDPNHDLIRSLRPDCRTAFPSFQC